MTAEQFKDLKTGAVVKLNSSNSKMTVTQIEESTVTVLYFNDKGVIEIRTRIPYAALTNAES